MKSIKAKMTRAIMKETTLAYKLHQATTLNEEAASAIVNALGFMQHASLSSAIDEQDTATINAIIEDVQGFGSFSAPGQNPSGTKSSSSANSYTAAKTKNDATSTVDTSDQLSIGDEVEIEGMPGEFEPATIEDPTVPGNTIQVKTAHGIETVDKDAIRIRQEEEIQRMQELAGIGETSAGSIGGMAMPMGQTVKREPSTPKQPRKKRD